MSNTRDQIIADLRAMLEELASLSDNDASGLTDSDVIPDSGVVDSAGLIEFVMLVDEKYHLGLEAEDMTVDNLGTLASIADFVVARRQPVRA